MMSGPAGFVSRALFAVAVFALLVWSILSMPTKRLNDFDQSFYTTIAYDLSRHGVFSNGVFDDVDSTVAKPPPGMFFAPLYPLVVLAVMQIDTRFAEAVRCNVELNHHKRAEGSCEFYARPMQIAHATFLTVGVVAIALAAHALFLTTAAFFVAGALAAWALSLEADLFTYIMTESLAFALYSIFGLLLVRALSNQRRADFALAGLGLGLLCLTRASFLVLAGFAPLLTLVYAVATKRQSFRGEVGRGLVFLLALAATISPWLARNAVSVGKLGFTQEYGAAALVERFAYNDMTLKEGALAFPYCVPVVGPAVVEAIFGESATARFKWNSPSAFFQLGRARRNDLVAQHGRLDPIIGEVVRTELKEKGWRYLLSSIPLAWCGVWVAQLWSVFVLPLFAAALVLAIRRRKLVFLAYAAPALVMVAVHAAVANHYTRYNLGLIGPAAAGASWVLLLMGTATQRRRTRIRPTPDPQRL